MCCKQTPIREVFNYRRTLAQSSVEYAIVFFALLAIVVAIASLWMFARDGSLVRLSAAAASHTVGREGVAGMQDILLY